MKHFLIYLFIVLMYSCSNVLIQNEVKSSSKMFLTDSNSLVLDCVELLLLSEIENSDFKLYKQLINYKKIAKKEHFQDSIFIFYADFQPGGSTSSWKEIYTVEGRRKSILDAVSYSDYSSSKDTFFTLSGTLLGGHRHTFLYLFKIKKGILNRFYLKTDDKQLSRHIAINSIDSVSFNTKHRYPDIYITNIDNFRFQLKYYKKDLFKAKPLGKRQ